MGFYAAACEYEGMTGAQFGWYNGNWCALFASKILRRFGYNVNDAGAGSLRRWCLAHGGVEYSSPQQDALVFFPNPWPYMGHVGFVTSSGSCVSGNWDDKVQIRSVSYMATFYEGSPTYVVMGGGSDQGDDIPGGGGGGGGGDEPYEPVWHEDTTGWQWNTNVPGGTEFVRIAEQRTVYRYFDYATGQWSELTTTKPT